MSTMEEKDVRGLIWLASMGIGLMLMIPVLWLWSYLLLGFKALGLVLPLWLQNVAGLGAAFAAPTGAVAFARHRLKQRYPDSPVRTIAEPGKIV